MDNEVELISDGDGLAVIGNPTAVERFMASVGLSSRTLGSPRLGAAFSAGASVAQAGSEIAANSGRWVKLTEGVRAGCQEVRVDGHQDARRQPRDGGPAGGHQAVDPDREGTRIDGDQPGDAGGCRGDHGADCDATADGRDHGLSRHDRRKARRRPSRPDEPGVGAHGRSRPRDQGGHERPRDGGPGLGGHLVEGAELGVRRSSRPRGTRCVSSEISRTRSKQKTKVGDLAKTAKEAEAEVQKWLAVLARCFQLHDAIGVLELDRVLDASPDELDRHRLGLKAARRDRLELISETHRASVGAHECGCWHGQLEGAAQPDQSPAVVESSNHVAVEVHEFHELLGIESGRESSEARRWSEAAAERWDKVRETGAERHRHRQALRWRRPAARPDR